MTITEMREKRNKLVGMMDTFLDTHTTDKGTLSAEDDKTYKDMETEVAQLTDSIHRMERREEIEAELSKPTSKPLTGKPMKADGDKAAKTGRASDEYKKALLQAMRTNFRQISNVLQEGIDPQGGYLVPDEYDRRLIDIGGVDYELVLTTRATKEIAGRYGGLENLGDKLMKSENFEMAIEEIVWLITLLANQSILIYNLKHKDKPKDLLTAEERRLYLSGGF